ncbi:putative bifunctional diguanylate cyclase/phosphodiesterase [Thalassomonas actiniarum]|uniref:EAL domain-containing protein n=1 Tax=Thalassomonas actiniarum TaxID=485447 RepID=A0AAE9YP19_9GAMM|nr:GGDEF domain-containing phosphodiesterase [Thalassomonas actiniarum]WDD98585.1 EAL domain-containing protein [Thalassomonas actiniarum]
MKSLQNKIFLFFVLLLLVVQAIALSTLIAGKNNQELLQINNQLTTAKTIFSELFDSRSEYLAAFAETAAKDYGIKQVFHDDTRSLLVAMNNHRKRINADIAMAIAADNTITGQLLLTREQGDQRKVRQGPEKGELFRFSDWLDSQQQSHLYLLGDAVYQLSLSPLTVGAKTIGWLAFGFEIDQRLALEFRDITGLATDFILKEGEHWRMVASSNPDADLAFAKDIVQGFTPDTYIGVGHFITDLDQQVFGVAMYGLRADFVEVLQKQWLQLLMLAVVTLLLSLAGAYLIAGSITKPITRLVEQAKIVASGDYHQTIKLDDQNELGQLADEFNVMQSAVLSREQAITHRANHDPLTDLPNRNVLKLTLNHLTKHQKKFALLHLNISRLKDVNDALGHDVGDRVITETANRLWQLTDFQLICHLGGDEFMLVVELTPDIVLDFLVNKVQLALEPNFDYQGICLQLQVRMGITLSPEHSSEPKTLLQMADTALHHTRKARQQLQVYHADLDVNSVERLSLINDLKKAITSGQLELFYQPKINLKSNEVTHVEALVRWQHPILGMVPPDNFIYIAEQTGQINALTQWVFSTALAQYKNWCALGITLNIAVNISAENLKDADFYSFVCQALTAYQVPAENVTLEVTESAVVEDPESAIALLSKFKGQGMRISIDDYGTGYSSLAQLKQLPVHELKIDKSFVQKLKDDEDDQIIVRSTIELAHNMGLSVVAEGIEDDYAKCWLAEHKCELGQGYFISRPKPALELTTWLQEQKIIAGEKEAL